MQEIDRKTPKLAFLRRKRFQARNNHCYSNVSEISINMTIKIINGGHIVPA